VQAWIARLRELAEAGVKVVRLALFKEARAERNSPDERDKQGKRYENPDDSHVARSAGRFRQETGFWLSRRSQRHTHFLATPVKPPAAMGQDPGTATSLTRLPGLPTGHDRGLMWGRRHPGN